MVLLLMQMPVWFTVLLESLLKNTRSPAFKSLMEVISFQLPFCEYPWRFAGWHSGRFA